MTKKIIYFLALLILSLELINCTGRNYVSNVNPSLSTNPTPKYDSYFIDVFGGGLLYHNYTFPGSIGNAEMKLKGEACSISILYLVGFGDSSIETAKKNAKITKVATVEFEHTAVLAVIYHSFCTVVTGSKNDVATNSESPTDSIDKAEPVKVPAKKGK